MSLHVGPEKNPGRRLPTQDGGETRVCLAACPPVINSIDTELRGRLLSLLCSRRQERARAGAPAQICSEWYHQKRFGLHVHQVM